MYDVIVVGLGAFGASTLKELSKKNKVLGLDASRPGSMDTLSFGQTRLFRQIYAESSFFTKQTFLARKAYKDLEQESGVKILYKKRFKTYYSKEGRLLAAIKMAKQHDIPYLVGECKRGLSMTEPEASLIDVQAYFKAIAKTTKGVQVNYSEKVIHIKENKGFVNIVTNKNNYQSKKIVLAAGHWSKELAKELVNHAPLSFERSPVVWFFNNKKIPIKKPTSIYTSKGHYFAIPDLSGSAVKVFNYYPSQIYLSMKLHESKIRKNELENIKQIANNYFDLEKVLKTHVGLYNTTPNENFIIGNNDKM